MKLKGKYKYQPTEKEMEVLKRIYKTDKEISEDLGIPDETVHSRVLRLYDKLDARTKAKAVIVALKLGYITLDDFEC